MSNKENVDITGLLREWSAGDDTKLHEVMPTLYEDLRQLARRHMLSRRGMTLQPTALVHEAYLRLKPSGTSFESREKFCHFMGKVMRNILVDIARKKATTRHGGDRRRVAFEMLIEQAEQAAFEPEVLITLDEAVQSFAAIDEPGAELLELRFFSGLTIKEIAEYRGTSIATVKKHLQAARMWLQHYFERGGNE